MRVGWLVHTPPYVGGAELTQAEFKAAAPEGVKVVDMPPGGVTPADIYVCQNVPFHTMDDLERTKGKPLFKYIHDAWPVSEPGVREYILNNAALIFCSPLHVRKFPHPYPFPAEQVAVVPPALDLDRFRPPRQHRRHGTRKGTCAIAQWRNPGKGGEAVAEWAAANDTPVDVFGGGDFAPHSPYLLDKGMLNPDEVAQTLWQYERMVFLPFDFEPFGRTVAEAHAAGCDVVTNRLVGASSYLENPEALETAAQDFWNLVCPS